jgi:hypothetical protein
MLAILKSTNLPAYRQAGKHQIPNHIQIPISNGRPSPPPSPPRGEGGGEGVSDFGPAFGGIGNYLEFGIWLLEFFTLFPGASINDQVVLLREGAFPYKLKLINLNRTNFFKNIFKFALKFCLIFWASFDPHG